MKALLFANRVVEPVGSMTGIGRYVKHLTRALIELGGDIDYDVSGPRELGRPDWLPPNTGYRPVPGHRRLVHTGWTALNRPRLERLVGDFDLVHALHPSYPIPTGRPGVITFHDLMPLQHPEWYRWDETWGFRRTVDRAGEGDWTVIADSEHVARQVRALGAIDPARITVVHLGVGDEFRGPVEAARVDAECRRWGLSPGGYMIAIGNISTRKNLVTIVRAVADVAPALGVDLVLAGRAHTDAAAVHAEIDRLGLGARVRLTGFVADDALRALLAGARALLHPSVDEGFGLPPLEAMAAGTPVIASRAGSLPEIVGDAGLLVGAEDVDGWASAMASIVEDPDRRAALIAAGRERAAHFTWERAAIETLAVHRRVLGP